MKRTTIGLIALFALIAAACVAFGAYFSYVTLLNAHRHAIESRFAISAERISGVAEMASSLGIALPAQTTLTDLLRREAGIEASILSIDVTDEKGVALFSSDPRRIGEPSPVTRGLSVGQPIENDLAATIGRVVVRYNPKVLAAGANALEADLQFIALPTLLAACFATIAIGLLLAAGLRRAAVRAQDPASWPAAARAALAAADAAHARAGETGGGRS